MKSNLCVTVSHLNIPLGRISDVVSEFSPDVNISYFRISEAVRIAGSLVFILLLFILTAVLVKVHMDEDRFFSVTMATIWFINCKSARLCVNEYEPERDGESQAFN